MASSGPTGFLPHGTSSLQATQGMLTLGLGRVQEQEGVPRPLEAQALNSTSSPYWPKQVKGGVCVGGNRLRLWMGGHKARNMDRGRCFAINLPCKASPQPQPQGMAQSLLPPWSYLEQKVQVFSRQLQAADQYRRAGRGLGDCQPASLSIAA